MDMLNIDHGMMNNYDDRRKKRPRTHAPEEDDDEDDEAAFHFIAFVPIEGEVWMLDGLNRQPEKLGGAAYQDRDWLSVVKPYLEFKMATYMEGQIEFGLLSLGRHPLETYASQRVSMEGQLGIVQRRLGNLESDGMHSQINHGDEIRELVATRAELEAGLARLADQVRSAMDDAQAEEQSAQDRRYDYGPVVLEWLNMLGTQDGLLKDLIATAM